ncbi:MAG: cytosine permease [Bryobacterales bacterium]|nr:cytosine permease [Bryobacterales bacterium]
MLPEYIARAVPNPVDKRAPWYTNTAPSYVGTFLWIAFYMSIAQNTVNRAGLGLCIAALVVAGLLSYKLYYYVPAVLGMKTGFTLYVVGSSTFGTRGGYLMPGLLMGVLQLGWFAVGTFISTRFILSGFGLDATPGTPLFAAVAIAWCYTMAYVGVKGIRYVAKLSLLLSAIPALMILIVLWQTRGGIALHTVNPAEAHAYGAFTLLIQVVIGFFATAGAAGADFGIHSRDERDVRLGGLVGIALAVVFAGGLPLISVAAARALNPALGDKFTYDAVISSMGGFLAPAMFFLFAIASVVPACFCAFITGNSFSTMIPGVTRMASTMAGVTVSVVLAITGVAENLASFFTIVGASFGPICGAMAADYLLSGRRWAGPREGVNLAGYGAWAVGFLVGIVPFLPVSESVKIYAQPAVVYSFAAGFVVYALLAKAGLEPKPVEMPARRAAA